MNKEKFYTPDLAEFHFGFEYQERKGEEWIDRIHDWHLTMPILGYIETKNEAGDHGFMYYIKKEDYRVKHLDREDIESFATTLYHDGTIFFTNDRSVPLSILLDVDTQQVIIKRTVTGVPFFEGTIRNKSELAVILKQIGAL